MKHIKLLFSISLFTLILNTSAQNIIDSARFLQFTFKNVGRSQVSAYFITKTGGSGRDFTYSASGAEIIERGDSIYINNRLLGKEVLYYNYALNEQDTFLFAFDGRTDTMVVDSIRMHPLTNGVLYKHWYLKTQGTNSGSVIWVKGLGEKTKGWVPYNTESTGGFRVVAICKHIEMIYWDNTFIKLEPYDISPTCNFEQFLNYHSVDNIENQNISIYPNPANDAILLAAKNGLFQGKVVAFDINGHKLAEMPWNTEEKLIINTTNWANGIYFLQVTNANTKNNFVYKIAVQH